MRQHGALFKGEMVRAILEDRKTQTRRPHSRWNVGDLLWVRETWSALDAEHRPIPKEVDLRDYFGKVIPVYRADHLDPEGDGPAHPMSWRPSIHMFKWASRQWLEVTEKREQRLGDITEEDAKAEGIWFDGRWYRAVKHPIKGTDKCWPTAVIAFEKLWESIHAEHDPEMPITAYTFKRVDPPDALRPPV